MSATASPEAVSFDPIEVLRQWEGTPVDDTVLGTVLRLTNGAPLNQLTPGHTTQGLADVHRTFRGHCSDRYQDLSELYPDKSKEQINGDPNLLALNSVRRILHQAMIRSHKQSIRQRK